MNQHLRESVSLFGLGYVGCVSAACLASRGHRVVGVDVSAEKVESLRQGRSPVVEDEIGELTADVVAAGSLVVTGDAHLAVLTTDVSLVCVGTPSTAGGGLSTRYLEEVTAEIGAALRDKDSWHVVVFRSTMVPGTCEELLIPLLERTSGRRAGVDFGVCVNPEFLREGTSVRDFLDPPKTVVGGTDPRARDTVLRLYDGLPGPRFDVPIRVAEMTKYVDNGFHALKIGFANEVGALCAALKLDSHAVMDVFVADTKLNISRAYLRPGFAFGGSCLPKDLRALTHTARRNDVDLPLLSNVLVSNEVHLRRALDLVIADGRRKVGILGLSFKAGTDDLRESPLVELAERLIGKGFDVKIHDANVVLSRLIGANRTYIAERLPHIGEVLTDDVDAVIEHADVLIVGSASAQVVDAVARLGTQRLIIDLVRLPNAVELRETPNYQGIGW
ncbi:nucleotide sugar dehydrogenase [Mycobacterium hodleri]|uniref:nucleotide sugar dehydrogenase n=1 Tax=Mycolicibacterium hodleri TaxID=49897 RepID=UPI0021F3AE1E|nr:nucleotide sugar dehydrogenase [Mycolicibacterium hodleri]MCV7135839.1 nucleotide sugar dehydrogenase [Mycolicibacterium hodleri]